MTDGADDFAVLLHLIEVGLNGLLPSLVLPATRRTHKALLFGTVPSPIAWDTSGKQREREGREEREGRGERGRPLNSSAM